MLILCRGFILEFYNISTAAYDNTYDLMLTTGLILQKISMDECLATIAESINLALQKMPDVMPVIENTAGQGINVGFAFEQIKTIIEGVDDQSRIGVCIDTCHAFAAGYDFVSREGYEKTWDLFNSIIGFEKLKGKHRELHGMVYICGLPAACFCFTRSF